MICYTTDNSNVLEILPITSYDNQETKKQLQNWLLPKSFEDMLLTDNNVTIVQDLDVEAKCLCLFILCIMSGLLVNSSDNIVLYVVWKS